MTLNVLYYICKLKLLNVKGIDVMEKITSKVALSYVLENCDVPKDICEKLEKMLASLEKKSGSERKPTERQTENLQFREIVLSVVDSTPRTVSEIRKLDPTLADLSNQRMSPIINRMVEDGLLVKSIVKGRSYFALAQL